ncbi:copper amine oxidase N-terminal domain-containing protein [Cohnella endophytica]|uniref:Copper amine oxidase N-terminal domain-containing protein n=1 Tax=Cohnella endophytica TaxID=2419778 RepID=A0A494Y2A1_9BACL|nr:copper amine oxidase N-terminal domain-containing protein [Cohnella endophytica]RKP56876.1 copper amine oxidase N-terminal domain-containing protein [Cohnella endophytica]
MRKSFIRFCVAAMLLCSFSLPVQAAGNSDGMDKLVVTQASKQMIHNGTSVLADQPLTATKGVTYVAARSLMKELFGTIVYDAKTKSYALKFGDKELKFTAGKAAYSLNGVAKGNAAGAPYVFKGTLMVPLKTVATNFGITLIAVPKTQNLELTWGTKPSAKFSVSNVNPYAEQTEVYYTNLSYHPRGLKIVDERWENNNTVFEQEGIYTVSHWVQDETGAWSDAYTVTVTVKPPNQPPVAAFTTDKDSYKMGELIQYADQSTDDENRISSRVWTNNAKGFFVAGPQTITLTVTDANGAVGEISKTINIEDETLHSQEEFNLLYTDIGDKFGISGPDVLTFPTINYDIISQTQTLIRANSPETIVEEGIYYEDDVSGNVRFLVHNYNSRSTAVKVYIIATNYNTADANVQIGPMGIGGPNPYVSSVARAVAGNFMTSKLNPKYSNVSVPAGQSKVLLTDYSSKTMRPGDVLSMFADVVMDKQLHIQVVVVDANRDVLSYLPTLKVLDSHDRHIRGTFEDANRIMVVNRTIGDVKSRMILADNIVDTRLSGIDKTTNTPVINSGNYGVMYTLRLNSVQPNTAIVVNPRGGYYAGAFTVNGKVVYATNNSYLLNPNEVGMLYKTGDTTESVTIQFTPASGSSLPINLLFMPMPSTSVTSDTSVVSDANDISNP